MAAKIVTLDALLRDDRVLSSSYASARTMLQHEIVVWDPEQILNDSCAPTRPPSSTLLTLRRLWRLSAGIRSGR